jgi:hypothetical protein
MAKRETKETYKDVKKDQATSRSQYGEARTGLETDINNAAAQSSASRDSLNSAIGGISDSAGQWGDFVRTGGYSPEREASIMSNVSGLKEMGRTGGLDDASINRFRGMGGYEEYAQTGGYTPKNISNIRSRALAPVSAAATSANDELARRRNVQGGYAPGFDAASRAIRRDLTRGISDVSRDAELEVMDRVNEGRRWGIGGLTSSENALQTLRTGNMFRGLTSAADIEMQLQNSINQYKAMGMSAQDAAARAVAELQGSIYSSDVASEEAARDRSVAALNAETNANLGYYGARNPTATQPGIGGNIVQGLGAAAGVAGSFWNPTNLGSRGIGRTVYV